MGAEAPRGLWVLAALVQFLPVGLLAEIQALRHLANRWYCSVLHGAGALSRSPVLLQLCLFKTSNSLPDLHGPMKMSTAQPGWLEKMLNKKTQNKIPSQLFPRPMLVFPTSPPRPQSPHYGPGADDPPHPPPLSPQSSAPSPGSQLCPLPRPHLLRDLVQDRSR